MMNDESLLNTLIFNYLHSHYSIIYHNAKAC
jgi:hypothetical protein